MTAKAYYSADGVTIYHGDCRDVLPELEADSVDLLLTDAPYGKQFVGQGSTTREANIKADGLRQGMRVVRAMLLEATHALKDDAHAYLFCHWESWPDFYDSVAAYLPIKAALIWWKDRGGLGDTDIYATDYEVILFAAKGRRRLNGKREGAVIDGIPPVGNDRLHPTEKPEALNAYLIEKSTLQGGLVVDPFMGVGSALVAAKRLGRASIGIELEERYCEIAAKRCQQNALPLEFA